MMPSSNPSTKNTDKEVSNEAKSEKILFAEHDQAKLFVHQICSLQECGDQDRERWSALRALKDVLDRYLEAPTLLDPFLSDLVTPLGRSVVTCMMKAKADDDHGGSSFNQHALSAVYAFAKVRGRKRIQAFLPHETDSLEPILHQIHQLSARQNESQQQQQQQQQEQEGPPIWESIYVLWMMLGLLSLTPFDCRVLLKEDTVPSMIQQAKQHLAEAGPIRDAAAACLASWLTRQDMSDSLIEFVGFSQVQIQQFVSSPSHDVFRTLGILTTLATVLKVGSRDYHIQSPLWHCILDLSETNQNWLLRKALTKWMARMGCAYLPPRIASWRYQRGGRSSLLQNLSMKKDVPLTTGVVPVDRGNDDDDSFDVPDAVEDVMGHLINSIMDKSTYVRWSAAKGIGRLTERLPRLCAHDVLDGILNQLGRNKNNDTAWHGSCLALGELARRGLLLPERLQDIVEPVLLPAIQFDVRNKGTPTGGAGVGAHVRDAACYTYWAFARAYAPAVLKPFVKDMSVSLVKVFLFDREVNCRRAASAAFQECVGRQGADNFPHGIDILTRADYYALGNRTDSFTTIAEFVAFFDTYRKPILQHLYQSTVFHWDIQIRALGGTALGRLFKLDLDETRDAVMPHLLQRCTDSDLTIRHGALVGVAEVVLGQKEQKLPIWDDRTCIEIAELVPKIEKLRLYRGRGGEIMRAAVCRMIQCLSLAKIPLTVKQQVRLLDSVDANLKHPNEEIVSAAANALHALMRSYFPVGESGPSERLQKRVVDKYVGLVDKAGHPAETRGYSLALGALPKKLLAPSTTVLSRVISCLIKAARVTAKVAKEGDAETRRNAVNSLVAVCKEVGTVPQTTFQKTFAALLGSLQDYNVDRRGDVGSWSRMAAMSGLSDLLQVAVDQEVSIGPDTMIKTIGGLIKQFAEKLDNVRAHAASCLEEVLLRDDAVSASIVDRQSLIESVKTPAGTHPNWANAKLTFPMVMKVASIEEYFPFVVEGIVVSVGGLTESTTKEAEESLLGWLKGSEESGKRTEEREEALANALIVTFGKYKKRRRVIQPMLKTIDLLFNRGYLYHVVTAKDSAFSLQLLQSVRDEEENCRDMETLISIVSVSIGLLQKANDSGLNREALAFVCGMLVHPFPRVRRFTADNLYVRLLEDFSVAPNQENEEAALEFLLQAQWDADTYSKEDLEELRGRLGELLGLVSS